MESPPKRELKELEKKIKKLLPDNIKLSNSMNLNLKYLFDLLIPGIIYRRIQVRRRRTQLNFLFAEAQTYALENNRAIKNAKIDLLSADKRIWETIAMGLPQLGLSANYQHQFVVPELSFGSYLDPYALPRWLYYKHRCNKCL